MSNDPKFDYSLDKSNILSTLENFPKQYLQGWQEIRSIKIPINQKINNIVASGMGGSVLGGIISKHLFMQSSPIPIDHISGYSLPAYVSRDTLSIIVSYSGNTEETLANYTEAKTKNAAIICMASGGKLAEMAKADDTPLYLINDSVLNPARVPRLSVGFQIGAYLGILNELKIVQTDETFFEKCVSEISALNKTLDHNASTGNNLAKQVAVKIQGKCPVIVSSQHLAGVGKVMCNQFNESGKNFACNFELPDVNHHQLEGMQFPLSNRENLIYVLLTSSLYHDRNKKRYEILKKLLTRLNINFLEYIPQTESALSQVFETSQFSNYMTYYLGLLNGLDPAPNPFVDEFKSELG